MGGEKTHLTNPDPNNIQLSFETEYSSTPNYLKSEIKTLVTLHAPSYKVQKHQPKLDLIFVIDKSTSMSGEKMSIVIKTLKFIISLLKKEDRMGIVTYSDSADVTLPITTMDSEGKKIACEKLETIKPEGCKDLCSGLKKAVEMMEKLQVKNEVSSILLFTDGIANRGVTKLSDILHWLTTGNPSFENAKFGHNPYESKVENYKKPSRFNAYISSICTIHTIGFGTDHNPLFLRKIADVSGGIYYYVETLSAIPEAFVNCFGGLISTVAKDIVVSITSSESVQIRKIHTKYPNYCHMKRSKYHVKLYDLQTDEQRDIVISMELPKCDETHLYPLLEVNVTYFNLITKKITTDKLIGNISRPSEIARQDPNKRLDNQKNRIYAVEALYSALKHGDKNDFRRVQSRLDYAINKISQSFTKDTNYAKNLVKELKEYKKASSELQLFLNGGAQIIANNAIAHARQRSSNFSVPSQQPYLNLSKTDLYGKTLAL